MATIRYSANGGTGAPAEQVVEGNVVVLSTTIPTKSTSGSALTVTYNGNGGTSNKTSDSGNITYWYSFLGWKTLISSSVKYQPGDTVTLTSNDASLALYAVWDTSYTTLYPTFTLPTATKSNTYKYRTVTINANGGSSSVTSRSSSCATRYTFSGWYTAASGGTKVGNGGATLQLTFNRTLYAQFTSAVGSYGSVTLPTASQCTRSGYKLLGFSKSSTATAATYAPGASYTPSGTETLYAVWKPEGLIRIGNKIYSPYVYHNGKWTQVIPYVYTNSQWKQGG